MMKSDNVYMSYIVNIMLMTSGNELLVKSNIDELWCCGIVNVIQLDFRTVLKSRLI